MKERSTSTQQLCSVVGDHTWRTGAVLEITSIGWKAKEESWIWKTINQRYQHCYQATWSVLHLIHLFHTLLLCPQHWISSYQSECRMSIMLLNSPVELINCGVVVCFQCCYLWLKTSGTLSCPCCYEQPLHVSMVWPVSNFVQDALRKISVICMNCALPLELGHYEHHLNSGCSYSLIESAIEGILLQPESAPLSNIESALQANLVRRSLSMTPDKDVMVF